jgi:hypothetical protein
MCTDYQYLFKWDNMTDTMRRQLLSKQGCKNTNGTENGGNGKTIFVNVTDDVDPKDLKEKVIVSELNNGHEGEHKCLAENVAKLSEKDIMSNTLHREDFIFFEPFDPDSELHFTSRNRSNKANFGVVVNYNKIGSINESILMTDEYIIQGTEIGKKCYVLNPQGKFGKNINYISVRTSDFQRMAWMCHGLLAMTPSRDFPKEADIALCPSSRKGKCEWELISKIKMKLSARLHLTYTEDRSTLLPPPFVTMCRNYSKEVVGGSRESCFLDCVKDAKKSYSPGGEVKKHTIDDECSKKCKEKDCTSTVILPKLIENMSPRCGEPWYGISIVPPDTPVIQSDTTEQVVLIQFLTDIGSTFGFWLGLSVIGVIDKFSDFLCKVIKKQKAKKLLGGVGTGQDPPTRRKTTTRTDYRINRFKYSSASSSSSLFSSQQQSNINEIDRSSVINNSTLGRHQYDQNVWQHRNHYR